MKRELIYRCKRCNGSMYVKILEETGDFGFYLHETAITKDRQFSVHQCPFGQYGVAELIGANEIPDTDEEKTK